MKQPLVSVVMPIFNAGLFLKAAVSSILQQSYTRWELIAIDDCSNDNSLKVLRQLAKIDRRLRIIINHSNLGQSRSTLIGIKAARGKYVCKMDQDDVAHPNRLFEEVSYLEKHPDCVVVGSNLILIDEKGRKIGTRTYPLTDQSIRQTLPIKSPFAYPSVCLRKSTLDRVKYPLLFRYADDYLLWHRLLKLGAGHNLKMPLLQYRVHPGQVKERELKTQLQETIAVQKLIFSEIKPGWYSRLRHIILIFLIFVPAPIVLWLFRKLEYRREIVEHKLAS